MDTRRNDSPPENWSLFHTAAFSGAAGPEESTAPIQVLGPLRLLSADGDLPLGSITQRAVLAHLLVHTNQVVATSQLVDAVWRGHPPASGRKIVQNTVSRLRRLLAQAHRDDTPEVLLLTRSPGYQLVTPPSALDVCRFQELTVAGREALAAGEPDRAAQGWRQAISLWRGPALADLVKAGMHWPELDTLHNWRLDLLEDLFDLELAGGRHELVLTELQLTAQANPHRERLQVLLMLALHRCSRSADALRISEDADARGLRTAPALRDAAQAIRTGGTARPRSAEPIAAAPSTGPAPEREPAAGSAPEPAADPVERRQLTVVLVKAGADWVRDGGQDTEDGDETGDQADQEDIDRALGELDEVVRREALHAGGQVAAQVGSLWLAVFGLRPDFGDHAHRAVLAAFAIRHGCAELTGRTDPHGPASPVAVRIAVATGEVLVRVAADTPPVVCGTALERCHAMVTAVPPMLIRVDAATHAGTDRRLDYQAAPGRTWTALGVPAGPPLAPTAPLIGRDEQLRLLTDLVTGAEVPHVVTVVGEPGSGRTRLVEELTQVLGGRRSADAPLLVCAPTVQDAAAPVLLARGVRTCCGISRWDPPELARTKLRRVIAATAGDDRERDWLAARLSPLAAVPEHGPDPVSDDLLAAWWRLVERVAAGRRTVVVVEDVDRAYRSLGSYLARLTGAVGAAPLLVVATSQVPPAVRWPDWSRDPRRTTQLRLPELDEPETARLVTRLLADRGLAVTSPLAAATVAALVPLAQGVPLRAEQYSELLCDSLGVEPDRAYGCLLSADAAVCLLPRSVRLAGFARLEELPPAARSVVRTAAAVGDVLWAGAVAECHGRPVESELGVLVDAGILVKDGPNLIARDTQFAFTDAATRHVAYAMLPRANRVQAHTRAVHWLGRLPAACGSSVLSHYRDLIMQLSAATGRSFDEILLRAAERLAPILPGDSLDVVPDIARYHLVLATTATRYPLPLNALIRRWHAWQLTHRNRPHATPPQLRTSEAALRPAPGRTAFAVTN